jgi:hypothetical protein
MATIFVRSNSDAWANGILKDDWDVTGRLRSDGIASCIVSFLKFFFFSSTMHLRVSNTERKTDGEMGEE